MPATTDLSDQHADVVVHCRPMFTNYGGRRRFSGPIATVSCLEDNVVYEQALTEVPEGTVVVVDGGGSLRCALMGDRLGGIAVDRGLPGVIINGCVRDTEELARLDVAVLALAPHPRRSAKRRHGARDVPVSFAGVLWVPGHMVYGDPDGVIVSPQPLAV
ncbi:MAG: ribonuclease E activity regulator RraA [Actinobacteria bacterium]|nr:ribonuclease E activity regulator RraA [Actinomycetota bacterium]